MKFMNLMVSQASRREKYAFCRAMGKNRSWANAMRDWHWKKIYATLKVDTEKYPVPDEDWNSGYSAKSEEEEEE